VIVVAHSVVYEKQGKNKSTGRQEVISRREQIASTSGPHASTMGRFFSDVLYFKQQGEKSFKIEATGSQDKEGGSRLIEPGIYNWDELSFASICKKAGIALPGDNNPLIDYAVPQVVNETKKPIGILGGNAKPKELKESIEQKPIAVTKTGKLTIGLGKK